MKHTTKIVDDEESCCEVSCAELPSIQLKAPPSSEPCLDLVWNAEATSICVSLVPEVVAEDTLRRWDDVNAALLRLSEILEKSRCCAGALISVGVDRPDKFGTLCTEDTEDNGGDVHIC